MRARQFGFSSPAVRRGALAGAMLVGGLLLGAPAVASASGGQAPSCNLVPPSLIKSDLGLSAAPAHATKPLPGEVRCTYAVGSNNLAVQVTFLTEPFSTFQQIEKGYTASGIPKVSGIGQAAYTPSIHTTGASYSDLSTYAHGTSLAIGAQVAMSKVEALGKAIIARL